MFKGPNFCVLWVSLSKLQLWNVCQKSIHNFTETCAISVRVYRKNSIAGQGGVRRKRVQDCPGSRAPGIEFWTENTLSARVQCHLRLVRLCSILCAMKLEFKVVPVIRIGVFFTGTIEFQWCCLPNNVLPFRGKKSTEFFGVVKYK